MTLSLLHCLFLCPAVPGSCGPRNLPGHPPPLLQNFQLSISYPIKQSPNTSPDVQGPKAPFQIFLHHYSSSSLCSSQTSSLAKCTQNTLPLSFVHAATFAWSGGPCISTNKLKESFRYSGKCHCLEKSCSLRQEDQSLCSLSPPTYFLLTSPVSVKLERQPELPSESISAGWSLRSSTHSCVALGFSSLFCKRVITVTLNMRTT